MIKKIKYLGNQICGYKTAELEVGQTYNIEDYWPEGTGRVVIRDDYNNFIDVDLINFEVVN